MQAQILIGCVLVLVTTVVHGACTIGVVAALRSVHANRWGLHSRWRQLLLVAAVVVLLFLAALAEATIWAVTYVELGTLADFEAALYFSMVTFTTLGYGDITLEPPWRLLGAFQAANGTIVFGWTTALIVALVQRVVRPNGGAPDAS